MTFPTTCSFCARAPRWPQVGNANFSNKYPCQLHATFLTAHFSTPQIEVAMGGIFLGSDFCIFAEKKEQK